MPKTKVKQIAVTQIKSSIGRLKKHKSCLAGLGLRKIGHTVVIEDTPAVRGMVQAVQYMLRVEEI
ncbi:MAG: 50S ribosomal protein L30 [Porticoccaceae bacterium]|jgi:large subunit ribosomal protein L30|nr:50S ribosomal protein L30 [Porticoccaceae bacterium]|tara:strand:+ start:7044 stop:7238 length:195 start_codon:yes stop_codon:yes gene_type:complete